MQKTLIHKQQHPALLFKRFAMNRHIRAHFGVFGGYLLLVFLGLLACTFFQLRSAACSRA